jgi:hypothetical protein
MKLKINLFIVKVILTSTIAFIGVISYQLLFFDNKKYDCPGINLGLDSDGTSFYQEKLMPFRQQLSEDEYFLQLSSIFDPAIRLKFLKSTTIINSSSIPVPSIRYIFFGYFVILLLGVLAIKLANEKDTE